AVTVVLHGSNKQLVDEVHRSFVDAISVTRNLIRDPRIVYGGASSEMRAAVYLDKISDPSNPEITSPEKSLCIRAYSEALMEIPLILAENSGLDSKSIVAKLKAKIFDSGNSRWLGVDALQKGTEDMKEQRVVESLSQKCQQIMQATEVFRSIIKVDTVRMVEF
ncbi:MAG: T-complex protein 1 subunit epsilon, partial [Paramarteilia canceri]